MSKPRWHGFESVVASSLTRYLSAKRIAGCRMETTERGLRLLDRFLSERPIQRIDEITPEHIDQFLKSRPLTVNKSYNTLLSYVRGFFEWLVSQGEIGISPVTAKSRRLTGCKIPYLYDVATIREILRLAGELPEANRAPNRGATYETIFALLAGLGLRIGEVSRLKFGDVDFRSEVIAIRNSKFGKSRLVPFGAKLGARLNSYAQMRYARFGAPSRESPFFTWDGESVVATNSIRNAFRDHIMPAMKLAAKPGTRHPCVHGLRHSFAVSTLLRMYECGDNPSAKINYLATLLGHSNLNSTAVYLTITSELLAQAKTRFEKYAPALKSGGLV